MSTPDILQKILNTKQEEIASRSALVSLAQLQIQAASADPVRGFVRSMQQQVALGNPAIIAEINIHV